MSVTRETRDVRGSEDGSPLGPSFLDRNRDRDRGRMWEVGESIEGRGFQLVRWVK